MISIAEMKPQRSPRHGTPADAISDILNVALTHPFDLLGGGGRSNAENVIRRLGHGDENQQKTVTRFHEQ